MICILDYYFWFYSAASLFLGQPSICQFSSLSFYVFLQWFTYLPWLKTTPWSYPRKFLNILQMFWWLNKSSPWSWGKAFIKLFDSYSQNCEYLSNVSFFAFSLWICLISFTFSNLVFYVGETFLLLNFQIFLIWSDLHHLLRK